MRCVRRCGGGGVEEEVCEEEVGEEEVGEEIVFANGRVSLRVRMCDWCW